MTIPKRFTDLIFQEVVDRHGIIRDGRLIVDSTRGKCVNLIRMHQNNLTGLIEDILRIRFRLEQLLPIMNHEGDGNDEPNTADESNMRKVILGEEFQEILAQSNPERVFTEIQNEAPGNELLFMVAEQLEMGLAAVLKSAIHRAAKKAGCESEINHLFNISAPLIKQEIDKEGKMSIAERENQRAAQRSAN